MESIHSSESTMYDDIGVEKNSDSESDLSTDESYESDQESDQSSESDVCQEGKAISQETHVESSKEDVKKTRKRVRNPDLWKRNVRKCFRNRGKAYVNSKGVVVPARESGDPCKCKMNCYTTVSAADRAKILEEFNSLASFDVQNGYLHGLIKSFEPKRRYTSKGKNGKRSKNYHYFIRHQGQLTRVCLVAFCSIHGISVKRVRNIRIKEYTPPLDQRGKHDNRPFRTPASSIECIKNHILSFPRRTSHYSRASNPNRRYLSPDLNIRKMHTLYLQKTDELGWPKVTESTYRRIFCEQFNFGFGSPRSDTCKTCDSFNCRIKDSTDPVSTVQLQNDLEEHHKIAQLGFESLQRDTELARSSSESTLVISFDLQQNLPTPHITTGLVFYLRQLWVYNLGIHNCGSGDGYMCMWPENIAARGSDEIASCLLNFIESLPTARQHLIAYSDSCGGQNKNFYIVCFWVYTILKGYFNFVDHKFLTPGHTYLPSDRDFALIEKKKESEVYIPFQWFNLVEQSRSKNPFHVSRMRKENFKNFKVFSKKFVNRKKTTEKKILSFQKVAWFRFKKSQPTKVFIRYTLREDEPWKEWDISRYPNRENKDLCTADESLLLSMKYVDDHPINIKKYEDLMKMKSFIPEAYHLFYNDLKTYSKNASTDAEDEDD